MRNNPKIAGASRSKNTNISNFTNAAQDMDAERTYKPRLAHAEKKREQALNT